MFYPDIPRKRIRGMYPPSGLKASSFGSSSSCFKYSLNYNSPTRKTGVSKVDTRRETRIKVSSNNVMICKQNKYVTADVSSPPGWPLQSCGPVRRFPWIQKIWASVLIVKRYKSHLAHYLVLWCVKPFIDQDICCLQTNVTSLIRRDRT